MVSKARPIAVALHLLLTLMITGAWLGAGQADGAQLTASWVDNSNGTAMTRLERRPATSLTFAAVADVAPGVTQYLDASVSPGMVYCYRALAFESTSASAYSDEACASPLAPAPLTLAFTNPSRGAMVNGRATVSLSASGGSEYTFTVKLDGTTIYVGTNPSFTWNTTTVTNGSHTLTATATDAQNSSGTATLAVTVGDSHCAVPGTADGECHKNACPDAGGRECGHRRRSHPGRLAWSSIDLQFALADALKIEYRAIVDAGFILQIDDPGR